MKRAVMLSMVALLFTSCSTHFKLEMGFEVKDEEQELKHEPTTSKDLQSNIQHIKP